MNLSPSPPPQSGSLRRAHSSHGQTRALNGTGRSKGSNRRHQKGKSPLPLSRGEGPGMGQLGFNTSPRGTPATDSGPALLPALPGWISSIFIPRAQAELPMLLRQQMTTTPSSVAQKRDQVSPGKGHSGSLSHFAQRKEPAASPNTATGVRVSTKAPQCPAAPGRGFTAPAPSALCCTQTRAGGPATAPHSPFTFTVLE